MTPDQASRTVREHLAAQFGSLLRAEPPETRRRPEGAVWSVPVVLATKTGNIPIAEVDVDEAGVMSPCLDADDLVRALRLSPTLTGDDATREGFAEADALFSDLAAHSARQGSPSWDREASSRRLREIFQGPEGDRSAVLEARKLLPPLLSDADNRGRVLMMMAEVERRLGESRLALGYLDAAANELADRFDMPRLERVAALAFAIAGERAFVDLPIRPLLHRCRARLRPLDGIFESPLLSLVPEVLRGEVEDRARLSVLAPGEALVTEGSPSTAMFLIKSGVLSVRHEKPVPRFVRCCSPGLLLGESSVLDHHDPRCTATLRAERLTEVWELDADLMRGLMNDVPAMREKILELKAVHGLDSFFSAHDSLGQLDAEVREQMLNCLQGIERFEQRTLIVPPGQEPLVACLVARGTVSLHEGWSIDSAPAAVLGVDAFIGVRDVLHRIATTRAVVAEANATIAFFDGERLRELAARSSEQAVLVLERLG